MGLSIYYRSIEPMHPALAYSIKQRAEELIAQHEWPHCDPPSLKQHTDGHLTGGSERMFADDEPLHASADDPEGDLLIVVKILAELSREHAVDWEFSHDYEPETVGRIIEGRVEPQLIEEITSMINIGKLFGDFIEEGEETWEVEPNQFGVWRSELQVSEPRLVYETEEPRVLKFPGVK
ncbi:MAG: hypothetical protein HKN47_21935 [Pirellulaceae bacterium]|nr:hypothetical protein [Pirellulaceae bacterium]